MNQSEFEECRLLALTLLSLALPIGLYAYMMCKRVLSPKAVTLFGFLLIAISGGNVALLQGMERIARSTPSLIDDRFFASGLSIALYLVPALFAGIGINLLSHLLINHLGEAEKRHEREHRLLASLKAEQHGESGGAGSPGASPRQPGGTQ